MKTASLALTSAVAALAFTSVAGAQSTDGRVRLGFDFSFAGLKVVNADDDSPLEDTVSVSSGFALDDTFVNIGCGLNETLTLGLRLRSGSITTVFTERDSDPTATSFHLTGLPYLEINLSDSGAFRPFIGPTLGLDGVARSERVDDRGDPDFQSFEGSFLFGAFFGARIFVNETFAFEPTLIATFGLGGFSEETAGGAEMDGGKREFTLMLLFGGSAWLGDGPRPERAPGIPNSSAAPDAYAPTPYPPAAPPADAAPPAVHPAPVQPAPVQAPPTTSPVPEQAPPPPPATPPGEQPAPATAPLPATP